MDSVESPEIGPAHMGKQHMIEDQGGPAEEVAWMTLAVNGARPIG